MAASNQQVSKRCYTWHSSGNASRAARDWEYTTDSFPTLSSALSKLELGCAAAGKAC